MRSWFFATVGLGIGALAAARFISSPLWVEALWLACGFAGVANGIAIGLLSRRLTARAWHAVAAPTLATGAAIARWLLLSELQAAPALMHRLGLQQMLLASTSLAWGAMALIWGALAISDALASPPSRSRAVAGSAGALAVAGSLYTSGPLWHWLGLPITVWSIAGLALLAALSYGAGLAYRALVAQLRRARQRPTR